MLTRWCCLDLETVPLPNALDWLPPVEPDKRMTEELTVPIEADKRLTDPAKIAADLAKKTSLRDALPERIAADVEARKAALLAAAALDADVCQIITVGFQTEGMAVPATAVCLNETDEARQLERIWGIVHRTRPMLGYGLTFFDAGVLVRRSQLLNVLVPSWVYHQGKYRHDVIIELSDYLTLNGMIDQKKGRSLEYHCQRFGIEVNDPVTGKDIGELWNAGHIEAIKQHCYADIDRIRSVAERLRVIPVGGSAAHLHPDEIEQTEAVF